MSELGPAVAERVGTEGQQGRPSLAERVLSGDRTAAARLISLVENDAAGVEDELRRIVPHTGRAHVVGVTGSPGSGKSTLVGKLARVIRSRGRTVGIVAVDPTSPFTGGAILGDRIRMQELTSDRGVFIRSMASRGALGGLARATAEAVKVLDAYGCQVILIETVGAGQDEVEIARTAHTTVVVQVPGMGDEVQAIKAGLLEVADVFAVNKADRARADIMVSELRIMLETGQRRVSWTPPIVKTIATTGSGVSELADAIEAHFTHLRTSGEMGERSRENLRRELLDAARQRLVEELLVEDGGAEVEALVEALADRRIDVRSAATELVRKFRLDTAAGHKTLPYRSGAAGQERERRIPGHHSRGEEK